MTRPPFLVTALETGTHDRSRFDCGVPALNRYLREQVSQDIRRRVAACFVALDDSQRIAAYYTLASASVPLTGLPDDLRRKLPRYGSIPAIRMGRLAVDREFKGRGLGGALLVNAMRRAVAAEIPGAVMVVEAKDPQAAAFYRHHGFIDLRDAPLTLFLPLSSLR
ncbi:GNAT family N-acetyltransferase [Herbaspirillum sp. AP02]|uniref:GNAT family N-acetyltransferase n=1 Tax=unclassified Herbaspirillum TaxID=2624150 RepID=UPI0015DB993E|nr:MULTISPECIES: GNAT family N-acetyltransferase [unclassified Herbaspirillum]MBG7617909.1 GNAT family N-acetyltransferase [Herbaspirillum sp. AP02]NZD70096.1 GNAT family N-acetyltransferase [Herbaspirillum sp. AP21]